MVKLETLGWDPATVGELDHRLLAAPTVKLRSATTGPGGDVIYCIDLRLRRPNTGDCLPMDTLHSLEHFLLEGFGRLLPGNFISVGVMGCQTGFYLVLLNEGRASLICDVLDTLLVELMDARDVPYARVDQCGNHRNHDLAGAQRIARDMIEKKPSWLNVI
jgi:S-ribosylhomocysteine lyase